MNTLKILALCWRVLILHLRFLQSNLILNVRPKWKMQHQIHHHPQQPYDFHFLPHDPGERIPISAYNVNDQDDVRRGYIQKGPCQPYEHTFPKRKIKGKNRHFSFVWFTQYNWLEYSISNVAAFCFVCYLFKGRSNGVREVVPLLKMVLEIKKDQKH